ncbi:hypothetical protein FQN53_006106 [Emmonsiellopsis sp. PD_33]|nr:hypothetical protein FQN53_006106 [Emmonsiellopsis sp. PD_33]
MSSPFEPSDAKLDIIVVGAGISGFTAAATARKAGHRVKILERSPSNREIGYSILLGPNATRVLSALGFDFVRARCVECTSMSDYDSRTFKLRKSLNLKGLVERFGGRWQMILRPDLHNEIKRVALDKESDGPVPELILGARVVDVDIKLGTVILEDGTTHSGDLIIGADGERSLIRDAIVNRPAKLGKVFVRAFRCLVPTEVLLADPATASTMATRKGDFPYFSDDMNDTILGWFEARDGTLHDFEAGRLTLDPDKAKGVSKESARNELLHTYSHYHPDLKKLLEKTTDVTDWPIYFLKPISNWTKGKAALVGDAAHSMFPTTGQGGCQSIEDAGALGVLLGGMRNIDELPSRLQLYQSLRMKRVPVIQAMSGTIVGKEGLISEKLHGSLPWGRPPSTEELFEFTSGYDVFEDSRRALQGAGESRRVKAHL